MYLEFKTEDNGIKFLVSQEVPLPDSCFPLKFSARNIVNNAVIWETDLNKGMWASYPGTRDLNFAVRTKQGILLREKMYSYSDENLELYEFWDLFCRINPNSVGLILGCGDGEWGEWVTPVNRERIRCHLVEASTYTFARLNKLYGGKDHVVLHNLVITENGGEVDFFEYFEQGSGLNTTNIEYLKKIDPSASSLSPNSRNSVSLYSFLSSIEKINWMRIDLEGIDADLILSLPVDFLTALDMVQFEHYHLESIYLDKIDNIFIHSGFKKMVHNIDTIYIK